MLFDASPPGPRDEARSLYRTRRQKASTACPLFPHLQPEAPVLGIPWDRRVVALRRGQQRDEDDDGQGHTDGDEVGPLQAELHLEVLSLGKAIRSCF